MRPAFFRRTSENDRDRLALVRDGEGAFVRREDGRFEWQAEGVGDGGVEVGDGDFPLGDRDAAVGLAMRLSAADAAAPEHSRECFRIMVAASVSAKNLLSRPPHRKRSELGRASGSEGV